MVKCHRLAPILLILAADRFGRHVLGSIYGLLTLFAGIGGSIGPILGGAIYDHFGTCQHLRGINMAILTIISLIMFTFKKGNPFDGLNFSTQIFLDKRK